MLTRKEIREAIRDLQNFDRGGLTKGQSAMVDTALGLFYEAYAQSVLNARDLDVDVSSICGFIRYVNVIPLNVSLSSRAAVRRDRSDSLAA